MDYWLLIKSNAAYRRVWLGGLISLAGDWFTTIALFTQLLELTGKGEAVGLVLVAKFLPHMIFGPVGGVIADRFDRKKVMILCDVARAFIVLGFLLVREAKDVPLAYALTFVQLSSSALFEPVEQAVIGRVVKPSEVVTANTLNSMSWSAMLAIGAVIGGVITSIVGRDAAFVIDACTYLLSAFVISGAVIPPTERRGEEASHGGFKDLARVLTVLRDEPKIRGVLWAKAGWGLAGGGALVLYPVFADRELGASSAALGLGLLYGARGTGALLGPFLARRFGGDGEPFLERAIKLSFWLALASYVGFAFAPDLVWACLALVAAHMAASTIFTFSSALINLRVPDHLRGRIFGADNSIFTIGLTVSTLAAGRALDGFGIDPRTCMIGLAVTLFLPALAWRGVAIPRRPDYLLRPDRGSQNMKKVLIALVAAIAILCVVIATRPEDFKIERSTTMNARPEAVFAQVNDFNKFAEWSPWEKLDPNMTKKIEGSPAGVGAVYFWEGNDDVGSGRMTITEAKSPEKVVMKLEFLKPMQTTNETVFSIKPEGEGSNVTWTMTGQHNFMGKAFSLFMNMDKMVGADFEKGLAQMKTLAEAKEAEMKAAEKQAAEAAAAAAVPPPAAEGAAPAAAEAAQPTVVK